mgnify:CR=1 FL=1
MELDVKEFVENKLQSSLIEIKRRANVGLNELNVYEEVLIYYYSKEGYEPINENLRDDNNDIHEAYLNQTLSKLKDYKSIVYRGAKLSKTQINIYKKAEKDDTIITEKAFTSTSKSILTANQYSKANTVFTIMSKTGKEIEEFSFFGNKSPQNEKEVLFKSKTQFRVLEVNESDTVIKIMLEEV